MVSCSQRSCNSRSGIDKKNLSGTTFHRFPKDPERRKTWINFVNRGNWEPSKTSSLCSKHFSDIYFDRTSQCLIRLRENAIPTLNPFQVLENMEEIKFFYNKSAVKEIKKFRIKNNFIDQWYHDQNISCYIMYVNDQPKSFALLSTMNFDPLKKHQNPKTLNYIYTLEEHRRKGFASKLIFHIKRTNQFTAFCSNAESENLFKKCECVNFGDYNNTTMLRYP